MSSPTDNTHIDYKAMLDTLSAATSNVQKRMEDLKSKGSNLAITDMFEMQMLMNNLSQLSEMSTSIVSASNSAISSMARNVKG